MNRPAEAALAGEDWELVVPKASTAAGHHADTQRRAAVDAATALVDGLLAAGCPPTALRDLLKSEDLHQWCQRRLILRWYDEPELRGCPRCGREVVGRRHFCCTPCKMWQNRHDDACDRRHHGLDAAAEASLSAAVGVPLFDQRVARVEGSSV